MDSSDAAEDRYLELSREIGNELLATFQGVCQQLNLSHYLFYGSLLGAVRYGDWIPWDDDVDVAMPREDFETFREAVHERLPEHVRFSDARSDAAHLTAIPRLLHLRAEQMPFARARKQPAPETRFVALDIFILDHAPKGRRRHLAWRLRIRLLEKIVLGRGTSIGGVIRNPGSSAKKKLVEIGGLVVSRCLPRRAWNRLHLRACTTYDGTASGGRSLTNGWTLPTRAKVIPAALLEPAAPIKFGAQQIAAPNDPRGVLTALYGSSFMTPPPESSRHPLHLRNGISVDVDGVREEVAPLER